jgi:hypothetical protein
MASIVSYVGVQAITNNAKRHGGATQQSAQARWPGKRERLSRSPLQILSAGSHVTRCGPGVTASTLRAIRAGLMGDPADRRR